MKGPIMSATTPTFGAQLLGQTEKALNAILAQLLAGTGVTEPQWVTLTLAVMNGGEIDRDQFVNRVAGALKVTDAEAQARINELVAAQLLGAPDAEGSPVTVTDAGVQLQ